MSIQADVVDTDGWFVAEDKQFVVTIQNATLGIQNITGWTLSFKVAATQGGSAIISKTAALTTPASGVCTVTITSADTSALNAGTYFYTLRRTDSGSRSEISYGTAVLKGVFVV